MDPSRHLALAAAVARRFMRPGLEWDDLEQAARVGLLQAARRFRPELGTAFSTFAVPYMVGEVRRWLGKRHPVGGLAGSRELARRAELCRQRLQAEGAVTLSRVAAELGVEAAELAMAVAAAATPLPLDLPTGAPPGSVEPPDEQQMAVRLALGRLPRELARIVYLRFYRGLTQAEVARELGLSQPVISRRERMALQLLRQQLEPPEPLGQGRSPLPEGQTSGPAKAP